MREKQKPDRRELVKDRKQTVLSTLCERPEPNAHRENQFESDLPMALPIAIACTLLQNRLDSFRVLTILCGYIALARIFWFQASQLI